MSSTSTPTPTSTSAFTSTSSSRRSFSTAGSLAAFTDAYEILDKPTEEVRTRILLTAEHAQVRLPEPYTWPESDAQRLVGTHWSYDPGTEDLTRELYYSFGSSALLSRFSRLLIDPNRPLHSDTLFRTTADGKPVQLNQNTTTEDRERRITRFHAPYHAALRTLVTSKHYDLVLSIHSFTPEYEGQKRNMEIGVLYCHPAEQALAQQVNDALTKLGYICGVNIPWSGLDGFMYAASTVAEKPTSSLIDAPTRRPVLMFEFRQDLLVQPAWRATLKQHLTQVFGITDKTNEIGILQPKK